MTRALIWFTPFLASLGFANADSGSQKLVLLDVSAVNAKGEAVTDLRAADIRLHEDGKQRPIVFFRFAGSKRPKKLTAPAEADNRPGPAPTVILLDRWNERLITTASASDSIDAALRSLESVDRVYIYFLTNHASLFPVIPLPGTEADLRAAETSAPSLVAKLDDAVRKLNGFRDIDAQDPALRVSGTLQALDALGSRMVSITGRKNLIWVTHGFPLTARLLTGDWLDYTPQLRALSEAAARNEITIYAVDQSAEGAGADPGNLGRATLEMVTALTGGRWYPSGNAERALSGAMTDALGAYRVAYYSRDRESDHKEHKIRIEPVRKGVRLLTREGYFDDLANPDADVLEEAILGNERRSPFDATEIGLRVAVLKSATPNTVSLNIHIDPADVLLERSNDRYRGRLTLMFASYSEGFLKQTTSAVHKDLNLTEEEYGKASKDGLSFSQDLHVVDKIDKVRALVYDRALHALGSVTIPIAR